LETISGSNTNYLPLRKFPGTRVESQGLGTMVTMWQKDSAAIKRRMAYVASGDKVDYVLGNIGGVIANAFEVLGDEHELESREHHRGIFHHVGEKFAEDLIADAVHLIIALHDATGQVLILANDRIQAVAHHAFDQFAHTWQVHVGLDLGMAKNARSGLSDIDGLIADSFEVAIDASDRQEEAQVGGHGRLQSQKALHPVIDLDLHFVDGVFFREDGLGQVLFGVQNSVHGLMHGSFCEAAHPQEPLLQLFEIAFEMAFHEASILRILAQIRAGEFGAANPHPKRPVM
jgi:hypothetical protein